MKEIYARIYGSDKTCISSKYSLEDLKSKFVCYNETYYHVFDNYAEYLKYFNSLPVEERTFHEVIFNNPQKVRIDVDAEIGKLVEYRPKIKPPELYGRIVDIIISCVITSFSVYYNVDLQRKDLIICHSTDPEVKFSTHIIIDKYAVHNNEEAKAFIDDMITNLLPHASCLAFIDKGVYKKTQNFRLLGNHKTGSSRVKVAVTPAPFERTLISNTDGCKLLPRRVNTPQLSEKSLKCATIDEKLAERVVKLCDDKDFTRGHRYRGIYGSLLVFWRISASHCDICDREHTRDHTLMIFVRVLDGVANIFRMCRKYNEENKKEKKSIFVDTIYLNEDSSGDMDKYILNKKINAGDGENATQKIEKLPKNSPMKTFVRRTVEARTDKECLADPLLELPSAKNVYCEDTIRDFELTRTLLVKARMKMGKTNTLARYLEKHFTDNEFHDHVIRFISFRQTFTNTIKSKFSDFTVYNETNKQLDQKRLIIQVESLWKLVIENGSEPPDLLILDECESIFSQINSGLSENARESYSKLEYLLRYSKHVVCMDAYLGERTYRILREIRNVEGAPFEDGLIYHCNTFKNQVDDTYFITYMKPQWYIILEKMVADNRVAIPTNSLIEAETIRELISEKYPDKKIKLYSSETSMSEKKEHFGNVNEHWSKYDVLIYTPTVSAGISFEVAHYDMIFAYFTDKSCDVETCIQMLGRVRNVAKKQYFICFNLSENNYPTEIEDIKESVYMSQEKVRSTYDPSGFHVEYNRHGRRKIYTTPYFRIWLENERVKNLSRVGFQKRFISHISLGGAKFIVIEPQVYKALTGKSAFGNDDMAMMKAATNDIKETIREEKSKKIAEARDISEQEFAEIRNKQSRNEEMSDDERLQYEKYRLRDKFSYSAQMTPEFVQTYSSSEANYHYDNLCKINYVVTKDGKNKPVELPVALRQVHLDEKAMHEYLIGADSTQFHDINRKFTANKHRLALMLLYNLGWQTIREDREVDIETIEGAIEDKGLDPIFEEAIAEFNIPAKCKVIDMTTTDKMSALNKILTKFYGCKVKVVKKGGVKSYMLMMNKLFSWGHGDLPAVREIPM